jgi:hypothetical protein
MTAIWIVLAISLFANGYAILRIGYLNSRIYIITLALDACMSKVSKQIMSDIKMNDLGNVPIETLEEAKVDFLLIEDYNKVALIQKELDKRYCKK